ncbi:MAG: bifunctional nuclease family protein [Acidimicrobiales bacterium]
MSDGDASAAPADEVLLETGTVPASGAVPVDEPNVEAVSPGSPADGDAGVTGDGNTDVGTPHPTAETTARTAAALVGDEAVPDEAVPDEAVPDEAVPDGAVPDEAVPDEAVPDEGIYSAQGVLAAGTGPGTYPGSGEEPEAFVVPTPMCRMLFTDVVLVLPATHPVVVLQEADPPYREIRIPVGGAEGVAISYAARQMATPRPLTHEFMTDVLEAFGLNLDMVRITGYFGRTFHAEIVVSGPQGSRTIDCRPSDAIALALRQRIPVPIMALPEVLDLAGGGSAGQN